MAARVEGLEVPGGGFGGGDPGGGGWPEFAGFTISTGFCGARFGFVMTGGGDEVAVTRMNVEVIKAWVAGEGIGQFKAHAAADLAKNFIDQLEAAFAVVAFEKGGDEDSCIELVGELLEKVA